MNKLLFGFFAGVAVGILFAPRKGSESRQKIRETFTDLSDKLIDLTKELVSEKPPVNMKATPNAG